MAAVTGIGESYSLPDPYAQAAEFTPRNRKVSERAMDTRCAELNVEFVEFTIRAIRSISRDPRHQGSGSNWRAESWPVGIPDVGVADSTN